MGLSKALWAVTLVLWAAFPALALAQIKPAPAAAPAAPPPAPVAAPASGGLFRCAATGELSTLITDDPNDMRGRECVRITPARVNVVPAPPVPGKAAEGRVPQRTDSAAQRNRDNDRRRILEDELAAEQKRLTELRAEFNNGEPERRGDERNYQRYLDRVERLKADISRSEANIDSLRRELSATRN
ncbi:MAG: DUF4124 domain-containing protein [Burkholderiales bacterium]|nr:DUF4124 domain-containing protein [Burkholderiales bacterium]